MVGKAQVMARCPCHGCEWTGKDVNLLDHLAIHFQGSVSDDQIVERMASMGIKIEECYQNEIEVDNGDSD